jgi:putative GTP pyrophosphokinase
MANANELLSEHARQLRTLENLGHAAEGVVRGILEAEGLRPHTVTHRIKEAGRLREKIERGSYSQLDEIHDLVGVRVITFFPDEVIQIGDLIHREFEVDLENSVDKAAELDPDRFGYLSLHFVVCLSPERAGLTENRNFVGQKCEIQVRSILQHAWAEIEHDLGYKTQQAIPRPIRRRFSRLAGLLEIADAEFQAIRDDIERYRDSLAESIAASPESVTLDRDSLAELIRTDPLISELDVFIAGVRGEPLDTDIIDTMVAAYVPKLQEVGLRSVDELTRALRTEADLVKRYAAAWLSEGERTETPFPRGIAVFYLAYVLMARTGDSEAINAYTKSHNLGATPDDQRHVAEQMQRIYSSVST